MTYDILWHLMTIVAWSAFRFTRKAVFASKALSVSTKNLAGKVRIEMKQHENVSQLMVVRVSSCFGTESPTYDDAKEPLNNWRSNLNTLCYLPYMLIRITFHAKSYVMSLQFDHVTPRETFDNLWQKRPVNLTESCKCGFLFLAMLWLNSSESFGVIQPSLTLGGTCGTILHFQHLQLSRGGSPSRWPKRRLSRSQRCLRESKKRKTLSWNHQALFTHFLPLKWFDLNQLNHWICWNCPMFLTSKRSNKQHVYNSLALNHPNPFTKLAMIPTPTTGEFHGPLTFARCPVASLLHAPAASSKLVKKNFTKLCFRSCFSRKSKPLQQCKFNRLSRRNIQSHSLICTSLVRSRSFFLEPCGLLFFVPCKGSTQGQGWVICWSEWTWSF